VGMTDLFFLCDSFKSNHKIFLTFRCWETSVSEFSKTTSSRCGNFVKTINEISFEEAIQLGYKRHTRKVTNIHTNTTEEE
jgi:hypothetical protein